MNRRLIKILFLVFISFLTPLISGCSRVEKSSVEELDERFKIVTKMFMEPFENGTLKLYDHYTSGTMPSIEMALASFFNADPYLAAQKKPTYYKFEGGKLDEHLIDEGFVAVSNDFYILVNNNGFKYKDITLYLDINGKKGPNKVGYDLFEYKLEADDKLVPVEYTGEALISKYYFSNL